MEKIVVLKRGKEKAILNRHHWIFSGAVDLWPDFENGEILSIFSCDREFLGKAYFNNKTSIAGRMLTFDNVEVDLAIKENIKKAIKFRADFFGKETNSYRLINSEGDFLPGLIVDKYNNTLVIQIATCGMEKLKKTIIDILVKELKPKGIYEKSDSSSRLEEGLEKFEGKIYGKIEEKIKILENSNKFIVDLVNGQKTGFYFDQREMRKLARSLARGRKVLNCFSYTGGFSVYAMKGGASKVDSIDISKGAVEIIQENFKLNKLDTKKNNFYVGDVFEFLRSEKLKYDFIILDPPAFCKTKAEVNNACRGYKDINRLAIEKSLPGSLLLTCSCSYFVDERLFQQIIFQAAVEAGRKVRIIQKHYLAIDHPINIFHPEGDYLKSLLVYVE
jgi:23S rRNA (cytosine1962-C5)-methyltransferase